MKASITIKGETYSTELAEPDLTSQEIVDSDIEPLRHMLGLTKFSLCDNQISDISMLDALVNLKQLSLDDSQISEIGVLKELTGLGWLALRGNPVCSC
jgi:Leucine-rich repeat (LRR) protein